MRSFVAAAALLLASCSRGPTPEAAKPATTQPATVVDQVSPQSRTLLDIARTYAGYKKLIEGRRWSPLDCTAPTPTLERSRSGDDLTHGRKLYYLFARD